MKVSETFWLTVLIHIQIVFILVDVILFLIIPKEGRRRYNELGFILIIGLIVEIGGSIGIHGFHLNMNLASNIFTVLNLQAAVLLYRNQVRWRHRNAVAYAIIIPFTVYALVNMIRDPHGINSYPASLAAFCLIVMAMTYSFVHARLVPTKPRVKRPMIWISTAILIYYVMELYVFLFVDYLVNVRHSNLIAIWMVHHSFGLVYFGMLSYSLILLRADHLAKQSVLR